MNFKKRGFFFGGGVEHILLYIYIYKRFEHNFLQLTRFKEYFKDDCLLNQTSTSTAPLRSSDCADWAAKGETASGIFEVDLAGKKYTPEIH